MNSTGGYAGKSRRWNVRMERTRVARAAITRNSRGGIGGGQNSWHDVMHAISSLFNAGETVAESPLLSLQ